MLKKLENLDYYCGLEECYARADVRVVEIDDFGAEVTYYYCAFHLPDDIWKEFNC